MDQEVRESRCPQNAHLCPVPWGLPASNGLVPSHCHHDPTRPTVTKKLGHRFLSCHGRARMMGSSFQDDTSFGAGTCCLCFFKLRPQASADKNGLLGHAGPVVFILKATRINLIHVSYDSAFPVIVREAEAGLEASASPSWLRFSPQLS